MTLDKVIEGILVEIDKGIEDVTVVGVIIFGKWISGKKSSTTKPSSESTDSWVTETTVGKVTGIVTRHDRLVKSDSSLI